ncbi:MAG: hypothetical protein IIW48_11415 [Clostridia bacterium]|nr:hypothetical protein [Clostridia bacterium]
MKSRYEHSVSNKEAEKIGKRAGVRLFNEYLKTEMPRIRETYAKLFVLTLHYGMGFGEKRIRKVLKDLAEMSCDMYNLAIDGVLQDVYDKRLKECGLWEAYEEFAEGKCVTFDTKQEHYMPEVKDE